MKDPIIDPERLAALIDGKLGQAERRVLLNQLARADDESLGTFADAVAVNGELENRSTPVQSGGRFVHPRWTRAAWLAAAAAVVAAVGVGGYAWRADRELADDPTRFVDVLRSAKLEDPAMRLWTTRGGAAEPSARSEALAVRIGACITDLGVAVRAGDAAGRDLVASIIRTLGEVDGSTSAIAKYRQVEAQLSAGTRPPEEQLRDAARSAARAAGPSATRAGAWVEAARLAAARRDRSFFTHAASRAVLDSIAKAELPEPAQDAVARVRDSGGEADPDWPALQDALRDLLGALVD